MLGISCDGVEENKAFAEKFDYPFPLLCDTEKKVAKAFGAVESEDDSHAARYTFVIGPDGKIEESIDTKDPGNQAAALLADA